MSKRPAKPSPLSLTPNPLNPRTLSPDRESNLRRSLQEFGDLGGIVYNKTTGHLIGGHQRVKVLEGLTLTSTVDEHGQGFVDTPLGRFAYREVEWDEHKEKLAMVAANKQGGEWDVDALQKLLMDVTDHGLVGFTEDEWEKLFPAPDLDPNTPPEPDPDDENRGIKHCCPQCGHEWVGKPA